MKHESMTLIDKYSGHFIATAAMAPDYASEPACIKDYRLYGHVNEAGKREALIIDFITGQRAELVAQGGESMNDFLFRIEETIKAMLPKAHLDWVIPFEGFDKAFRDMRMLKGLKKWVQ